MSEPTLFTKIINGDIPSHKIYEDERTYAFLDINPVTEGHTLVIPKTEVEFVWDLDDDDYLALMATARKVARRVREVIGQPYVGEMIVGTDVPHAHVHIVAFEQPSQMKRGLDSEHQREDDAILAAVAEKLRF